MTILIWGCDLFQLTHRKYSDSFSVWSLHPLQLRSSPRRVAPIWTLLCPEFRRQSLVQALLLVEEDMKVEPAKGDHGDVRSGTDRKDELEYGRYPSNLYKGVRSAGACIRTKSEKCAGMLEKSRASCEVGHSRKASMAASCSRCPVRSPAFSGLACCNRDAMLSSPMGEALDFPKPRHC